MVFKSENSDGIPQGDTESWNIAPYFTASAISLPLRELNELEDIARFGSFRMDDDVQLSDDLFVKKRAEAVKRYQQKLRQIIADTKFKVKKGDKTKAEEYLSTTNQLRIYCDIILNAESDYVSHEERLTIDEKALNLLMDRFVKIKMEYLAILNRAGLIFRESSELDLDKLTNDFISGG